MIWWRLPYGCTWRSASWPVGERAPYAHCKRSSRVGGSLVTNAERVANFLREARPHSFCDQCVAGAIQLGSRGLGQRNDHYNPHIAQQNATALSQTQEFGRALGVCDQCGKRRKATRARWRGKHRTLFDWSVKGARYFSSNRLLEGGAREILPPPAEGGGERRRSGAGCCRGVPRLRGRQRRPAFTPGDCPRVTPSRRALKAVRAQARRRLAPASGAIHRWKGSWQIEQIARPVTIPQRVRGQRAMLRLSDQAARRQDRICSTCQRVPLAG